MRIKYFKWPIFISLLLIITLIQYSAPDAYAEDDSIRIVIDGKRIKSDVEPYIKNDRALVPVRVIAEELDSVVEWDNDNRAVHISKEDTHILLRIDSYLVEYTNDNETTYAVIDVAPEITGDRTFVPIRLISNALGVGIEWDNERRAVLIDSSESSKVEKFFDVEISSVSSGQTITGITDLYTDTVDEQPKGAVEIKYLLLDRDTAKGFVVASGDIDKTHKWVPAMEDNGKKILVAAFYDAEGNFLAGDSIPVTVKIDPRIELKGIREGQLITAHSVPLSTSLNFSAAYVKYEMINPDNGAVYLSPGVDPEQSFTMIPVIEDNGHMSVRVIAYDTKGNAYPGQYVNIGIDVKRYLNLGGVKNGQTIDGSVTLLAQRNFNVTDTEYYIIDNATGRESLLFKAAYGSYSWFPGPEDAGSKDLYVKVKDTAGNTHLSSRVGVNVTGSPKFLLQGVGPGQVLTEAAKFNVKTNVVELDSIKYILTNSVTGQERVISEERNPTFTPDAGDSGSWSLRAEGTYGGKTFKTEEVKFTIYTGELYPAKPVIEKDLYLDLVSGLAVNTRKTYGMSAALQTAQAILETGWGQKVPVDKYNGNFSYNLFGIKGSGTKGSVISSTWEEYNGVAFTIDAEFRAYNNEKESWQDHKDLLLLRERYAPFREVMHDSTKGAWALKRCGYATDSQYAIKLIDIINRYGLRELDEVTI